LENSEIADDCAAFEPSRAAIYFDGKSSRRRRVILEFKHRLEFQESTEAGIGWSYADIRRVDAPSGTLRLGCLTAPALARVEIRNAALAAELRSRCAQLDDNVPGRDGVTAIIAWSMAAMASIISVIVLGLPLAADRLATLMPPAFERRLAQVAIGQLNAQFNAGKCNNAPGQAAFVKLLVAVRKSAGMEHVGLRANVLSSPIANAFALPGDAIYLLDGLLAEAENPDEIAGILAHELGHLKHRDSTRALIYNSGASFLIGLLFGDITGSSALIFASRSLVTASYSREAEQNADTFAIDTMHRLGRSPKPMGQLIFRVTEKEADDGLSLLSSHPLTEDRLARMSSEDRPPSKPPLLTAAEWASLKAICK
jgi:Zn-dependent protease with chaperone function